MDARYELSRWLFLRLLGLVYLIALVSYWVQIEGLIGSDGILPLGSYLGWFEQNLGAERYWRLPTLFWAGHGDGALHAMCAVGVALALALIVGVATLPVLFALWVVYLSLVVAGQTFLSFQWDMLLLETGFAALFVAPVTWLPRRPRAGPRVPRRGIVLLRALLFKLMFLSGIVKLISMDETWWKLTALDFHYFTQPLPAWTSWYAHQLPGWFQKTSVFLMFVVELLLPFLIFFTRRLRVAAFVGLVALQLAIAATGNYGFFNLLTVVLCIPVLDDAVWIRWTPERFRRLLGTPVDASTARPIGRCSLRALPVRIAVASLLLVSVMATAREMVRSRPREGIDGFVGALFDATERYVLHWGQPYLLAPTAPFRSINGYGLFRAMTTRRPEIVIEGSADGRSWKAYGFRWKVGEPSRPPGFVQPHMPRLDWQMWFAALNPRRATPWLRGLSRGLLEGSPAVLALIDENPFPDAPPRYLRMLHYDYAFTTPAEREQSGDWWKRGSPRVLMRPTSRGGG